MSSKQIVPEPKSLTLERFLAELRSRLIAYAHSRGVGHEAEDLAQDSIQILLSRYPHLEDRTEILRVAYVICRNKCLEAVRRKQREAPPPADDPAGGEPGLGDLRRRILQAAGQLGQRCRQIFLRQIQGYDANEIAAVLGITVPNFHVQLHRCRKQLRALIEA